MFNKFQAVVQLLQQAPSVREMKDINELLTSIYKLAVLGKVNLKG